MRAGIGQNFYVIGDVIGVRAGIVIVIGVSCNW